VRETIIKMKPSCRAEFPGDVAAKFFWNNC